MGLEAFFATAGNMSWFEIGMLLCFAASWPVAIYKTYTMKLGREKSRLFSSLLALGYLFGIVHKVLFNLDVVVLLYLTNMLLVLTDLFLGLYYRYQQTRTAHATR